MTNVSTQLEKHVLGGLLREPSVFADIEPFISEKDFYVKAHTAIFKVLKNLILKGEPIDSVIVSEKIKSCGASDSFRECFGNDITIFDYLDNLSYIQITPNGVVKAAGELVFLRVKRETSETADEIKKLCGSSKSESLSDFISEADSIYNNRILSYTTVDDKPQMLNQDLIKQVDEAEVVEEFGFMTPFPEFNRLYGGFRSGNLYCFSARAGQGKSTILNHLALSIGKKYKIPVLIIDTEMQTKDIRTRMLSSASGLSMHMIETGQYKKNEEAYTKIKNAAIELENMESNVQHYQAGNKSVEEIVSKVRRWILSDVGRGNPALVLYDYLKLTGEKVGNNWAEYQAMGEKVSLFHQLSMELNVPILTAVQANRSGESFNRRSSQISDDSSSMAVSDRIQWFCSLTAGIRRKTIEEIAEDEGLTQEEAEEAQERGEFRELRFGTHKMTIFKSRFQGEDARGHQDFHRRTLPDGSFRYENNYLNVNISNFKVEERGSLESIIRRQSGIVDLNDQDHDDGDLL